MKLQNQQREADSLKGCSKEEISEMKMQLREAYEEQLKRIVETVFITELKADLILTLLLY